MLNALRERYESADLIVVGVFSLLIIAVPILNLWVPETSALHVSTYSVTLLGKYMCYAMLALSVDLVWGYCGIPSSLTATHHVLCPSAHVDDHILLHATNLHIFL